MMSAPICAQRIDDAAHRAARQAGVADKGHGDRVARDKAHQQARRRAAIAHVERFARLEQPADADAVDAPFAVVAALDRAPIARIAAAVASTSCPSSSPVTRLSPTASAESINERCEMLLSPGIAILPLSGTEAEKLRGVAV
jgi:hypothetical protein